MLSSCVPKAVTPDGISRAARLPHRHHAHRYIGVCAPLLRPREARGRRDPPGRSAKALARGLAPSSARQERQIAKITAAAAAKDTSEAGSDASESFPGAESTSKSSSSGSHATGSSSSSGSNAASGGEPVSPCNGDGETDSSNSKKPKGHGRNGGSAYRKAGARRPARHEPRRAGAHPAGSATSPARLTTTLKRRGRWRPRRAARVGSENGNVNRYVRVWPQALRRIARMSGSVTPSRGTRSA